MKISGFRQKREALSIKFSSIWILAMLNHEVVSLFSSEYDFIIVGGGTTGSVIASRLSEVSDWNVLLIEAGGEPNILQDVPLIGPLIGSVDTLLSSNWGFKAEKSSDFGLGLRDGQMLWPQGKGLGGSSSISAQVYTRGNRIDFNNFEKMGNVGWGYNKILPYILKSEKMEIPTLANDTKYHSTKGYMDINYLPFRSELATVFVAAGVEKGYRNVDVNGASQIGFAYTQTTTKDGRPVTTYSALLKQARTRKNLHVWTNRVVTKILINPQTRRAYGVEYLLLGLIPIQVLAKKEVILSAGVVNSPKLLMLSGIGPKEHLEEVGIKVLQDSPVGQNLKDQVSTLGLSFTVNTTVDILPNLGPIGNFFAANSNPLTDPIGFEALSFLDVGDKDGSPEIELLFSGKLLPTIPSYLRKGGILSDELNNFYQPLKSKNGFTVLPVLRKPRSSGFIKLRDKNPYSAPLIYPNYFSDPSDMNTLVEGVKTTVDLLNTDAFRSVGADLYREPLPACESLQFASDEYWECSIRQTTASTHYAAGSNKMGPASDKAAVVDPAFNLNGFVGLRVADTSITAIEFDAFSPVLIGESASAQIKVDVLV